MKISVHRKVEVWVDDIYEIENMSQIQDAINYDIDCKYSDTLWETLIDLGPVEVYDENYKLLYKKDE
jgi:hypothetical protein